MVTVFESVFETDAKVIYSFILFLFKIFGSAQFFFLISFFDFAE